MVLARTPGYLLTLNLELREAGSALLQPKPEEGNGRVRWCQKKGKAERGRTKARSFQGRREGEAQWSMPSRCTKPQDCAWQVQTDCTGSNTVLS